MIVIVLDSTALIQDFFLRSAAAQSILDSVDLLETTILVPAPVVDEVCANYRTRVYEHEEAISKIQGKLASLGVDWQCDLSPLSEAIDRHDAAMRSITKNYSWPKEDPWRRLTLAPYPDDLPHAEVVEALYQRRAPVVRGEVSYKDYVIWRSVVDWIKSSTGVSSVWVVTSNTKDFVFRDDLHPDLRKELTELGINPSEVSWCRTVRDLADSMVKPRLGQLESVAKRLRSSASFLQFIRDNIEAAAVRDRYGRGITEPFSLPCYQDSDHIASLESIDEIKVHRVYQLSGRLAADGSVIATGVVVCSVGESWMKYVEEEILDVKVDQSMPSEDYGETHFEVTLKMAVELIFTTTLSEDGGRVDNLQIVDMSGGSFKGFLYYWERERGLKE